MQSPIVKEIYFSDLDTQFTQNPVTDDVVTLKNFESIKRSIRNIISTNKGERPLNPEFGSNVRYLLFEPDSDLVRIALEDEIRAQILNFEPRVELLSVTVSNSSDRIDNYELDVIIEFSPLNSQQVATLNVVLERVR
jgi:phage baseplate assembly protein W